MAHVVGVPRRDPCQKCQLPVFLAERLTVGKKVFHRTCLKCARCSSQLTPGSFYETEVDNEYCCETCPDEEIIGADEAAASSSVLLRNRPEEAALDVGATSDMSQGKTVRSSIADRLAFFEQSKGTDSGHRLLQKSVTDEEKTKSLKRMEADTMGSPTVTTSPYRRNTALSSFLKYDDIDGDDKQADVDSEPTSTTTESKTETQMETSDSEEEAEGELDNDVKAELAKSPPALPKSQPPVEEVIRVETMPNKRFTATAQLQLLKEDTAATTTETTVAAQIGPVDENSKTQIVEEMLNDTEKTTTTTPDKHKSEIKLNLTNSPIAAARTIKTTPTITANDNANNNGYQHATVAASTTAIKEVIVPTESEVTELTGKSLQINLDLSQINANDSVNYNDDCVTKEKIADTTTDDTAATPQATRSVSANDAATVTIEQIKTELHELESESSTDVEAATNDDHSVELRVKTKEQKEATEKHHAEDIETTERLSVVRARLQQFEVIANNNKDNVNPISLEKANNDVDDKSNLSDTINNSTSTTITTTAAITNNTIDISTSTQLKETNEPASMPQITNVRDEAELNAMEIEPAEVTAEKMPESLNEVPLPCKAETDHINVASKPNVEVTIEEEQKPKPITVTTEENVTAVHTKEAAQTSPAITQNRNINVEYPDDLNPFKSDDDEDDDAVLNHEANKENRPQSITTSQARMSNASSIASKSTQRRDSLNPFDSSDDEIELEKSHSSSTAATTPSSTGKVPPPRPPPPRISRNPFGDEAGDEDADFSRRSSLTSSISKKTPVPTPRTNLSQNPTPEPTPRLSTKTPQSHGALQNSSEFYGSANSLTTTPQHLQRNSDVRGSNNSLTSSAGGTIRSRKSRKAPAPPAPLKELFPSTETIDSSITSTPSSSTKGTPKTGRKKRLAPAPPKPARLDPTLLPQLSLEQENNGTPSKNLHSYPLQSESDSKLSDEEKALLEGKILPDDNEIKHDEETKNLNQRHSRRLIPLDASLLEDDDDGDVSGKSDDAKEKQQRQQQQQQNADEQVVYRRVLIPTNIDTPTHDTNPLLDELNAAHDRQLEKLKDNKEANNRNRQSQLSASSGNDDCDAMSLYNKSSHGKWKRRKGPAPALPIPPRKVLQMLPLQEIRHELEIIEVQQQGLEKQGVILEKMIRDRCEGQNGELLNTMEAVTTDGNKVPAVMETVQNSKEVEDLILQLFELVNEKNELFRRQAELMYLRRQHRLEQEQADLEYEIRVLMAQPERNKTDTDKAREEVLIARLVEVVQLRNDVIDCLEMDRLREAEEDLSIKQRLELHTAKRENDDIHKQINSKLSKKEKKKQKEAKKLSKSKKIDADKDADETELNADKLKLKKKKKKFIF